MSTARKMLILLLAIVALVIALVVYNAVARHKVSTDPKQLFTNALKQNLGEKAVTCTVERTRSGTNENLAVQLDLAGKTNARSVLTVKTDDTTVQTEEVVLKSGDYLRYTKVDTKVKNANGDQPDLSKLVNKWIKTDGTKKSQLFGLTALGGCVVPLASIPTSGQVALARPIDSGKVFATDYNHSEVAKIGDQLVRQYAVEIAPQDYVKFMQTVGQAYGLDSLNNLDLRDYSGKQPRKAVFSVNTETGRLVQIRFTDESRVISFTHFGEVPKLKAPGQTITNAEAGKLAK